MGHEALPGSLIQNDPACPFTVDPGDSGTWIGPDLAEARQLVAASHTEGMRVVV